MRKRASSPARRPGAQRGGGSTLVTERDRRLLAFVAEHRIVLVGHVQALLGVSGSVAYGRLRGLTGSGLLQYSRVLHGEPGWYQITRAGLAMIDSDLPTPRLDLRCYRHDIGVAWLWLAASRGAFGGVERIVSEREMRSRDAACAAGRSGFDWSGADRGERVPEAGGDAATPFGVHLGGVGPRGQARLHYPDLLLVGRAGERVAIELELTAKGGRRLETILIGYGAEPSIAAVLYLAEKPRIRREVAAAAARLGISDLIHVQPVAWPAASAASEAPARAPVRAGIAPAEKDQAAAAGPPAGRHGGPASTSTRTRTEDSRGALAR
jgi:hypothetical protein